MKFSKLTKERARLRQWGPCALCGRSLDDLYEHAHHLIPHSLDGPDEVENCAILCEDCHDRAHADGRFRSGVVAPRSEFRYLNGRNHGPPG